MRRASRVMFVCLTLSTFATACSAIDMRGQQAVVSVDSRKAAFRQILEIWRDGKVDLVDAVVTGDYVGHTSTGDRDIDGLRKRIAEFHALYPDITFTVEDQLAEGDRVTTRMTAIGTSQASGKPVRLIGVNISRFVGNRIAEEWPVWEVVR